MSASRQKKLREEQLAAAESGKQSASAQEAKDAKKLKLWTALFYVAIALMIVGIIAAAVVNSGLPQRMMTAVTVGEHKLSAAEMNYFFGDTIQSQPMLSYMIQPGVPLDRQPFEEGKSMGDYVLELATTSASNTYAVYDEAMKNGFVLPEEDLTALDQQLASLDQQAKAFGFSGSSAFLRANYGIGCNESTYREYLEVQSVAAAYATQIQEGIVIDDAAIQAEAEANPSAYSSYDFRYFVSKVRDYQAEEKESYTDEEIAAASEKAKAAADQVVAKAGKDSDAFKAEADAILKSLLAEGEEMPEKDSTLFKNQMAQQMPTEIVEWMTDAARQPGDTTVIEGSNGAAFYSVMYLGMKDNADVPTVNVRHILVGADGQTTTMEQALAKMETIKAEYMEDPTEEHFAAMVKKFSEDPGSVDNGGLYEGIAPGQMVKEFNDWIFDEGRAAGDVDVVETEYGCHLIYFVGSGASFRDTMISQKLTGDAFDAWFTGLTEGMTTATNFGARLVHTDLVIPAKQG